MDKFITPCMVQNAIDKVKSGKACVSYVLSAEVFSKLIGVYLFVCPFAIIISHEHLPGNVMNTIIIPLITNKSGGTTNVSNCIPIALFTVA